MFFSNVQKHASGFGSTLILLGVACVTYLSAGCGGDDTLVSQMVTGKVTFEGAPVEEGNVTFEDPSTGSAVACDIGPGGVYSIQLPDGNYKVTITPPYVEVDMGEDSPPDEQLKEVDNIPEKYRDIGTTDLSVEISGAERTYDLEMTSQ